MKFKQGDLSREAFKIIMYDLESLAIVHNKKNTYHYQMLQDNLKDIFDFDLECANCGEWLKVDSEDMSNSTCMLCKGEAC